MSPKQFKEIRKSLELSQDELAEILGVSGKMPISHYETGFRTPNLLTQALMSLLDSLPERKQAELIDLLTEHMKKIKRQQKSKSDV